MSHIQLGTVSRSSFEKEVEFLRLADLLANLMKLEIVETFKAKADPVGYRVKLDRLSVGGVRAKGGRKKEYDSLGIVVANWLDAQPRAAQRRILRARTTKKALDRPALDLANDLGVFRRTQADREYLVHRIDAPMVLPFVDDTYVKTVQASLADKLATIVCPTEEEPAAVNQWTRLRLHSVKCIDPTDWEPGADEIYMGGVALDWDGSSSRTKGFKVKSFNKNNTKTYTYPAKELARFSLKGVEYPRTVSYFLAMTEKDDGEFGKFLWDLWNAVKAEVVSILSTLAAATAGATIGVAIGGSVGTAVGGLIGAAIGIIVGMIVGALIGWLHQWLQDDVFEPEMTTLTLPSPSATFGGGGRISPTQHFTFADYGGLYRAWYEWEISAA